MKTQAVAVLFCSLLLSSFGHEYLEAYHLAQEARLASSSSHHSHIHTRALQDNNERCGWVCPVAVSPGSERNGTGQLTLAFNENRTIIAVVNETAHVALAIDVSAHIVAVFDGSSGAVVIIDIRAQSGAYIAAGVSQEVWLSSKESFNAYIGRISSLTVVLEIGQKVGQSFDLKETNRAVVEAVAGVLVHLSAEYAIRLRESTSQAIEILISISVNLTVVYVKALQVLISRTRSTVIHLHGDIVWFYNVVIGLGAFFEEIEGGVAVLIEKKVELDWAIILGAASGAEALIHILVQIQEKVNLAVVLGAVLNSQEQLLFWMVRLGGESSEKLNGLIKIVYQAILVIHSRINVDVLIHTLIYYSASARDNVQQQWAGVISGFANLTERIQASEALAGFVSFVRALQSNTLIVGSVHISEVIQVLHSSNGQESMHLVVSVLVQIKESVSYSESLPTLVLNLLGLLNSTAGVRILRQVVVGININEEAISSSSGNLVERIFAGVNVKQIILGHIGIVSILEHIPIIGHIYSSVSSAVQAVTKNSVRLGLLFVSVGALKVVGRIAAWFMASFHVDVGLHIGGVGHILQGK